RLHSGAQGQPPERMGRVLQRRLEVPAEPHVKSWRALRLLWRAVGEKRFDGISNQRKCGIVWHFGNGFQRAMESVRNGRFVDEARIHRQEFAESEHAVVPR